MSVRLAVAGLRLSLRHPRTDRRFWALFGIELAFSAGEVAALVGGSAVGKSLLAHALLGLAPPGGRLGGEMWLDGRRLARTALAALRGGRIALVPQHPARTLDPRRTVRAQLREHLRVHRIDAAGRVEAALEEAGLDPASVLDLLPDGLSGGMAQRVALGFALATDPDVIVADEPTAALDLEVRADVMDRLTERARAGAAVLIVTHDLDLVVARADRVHVMAAGRILESGPPAAVARAPRHPYARALWSGRSDGIDAAPDGCPLRQQCDRASRRCAWMPGGARLAGRWWACHHPLEEDEVRRR